mgnify:FL=1
MKRNWSKKALSLLMAGTMMAGLAGCGSDAAQNDSSAAASAAQSSAAQSTDASTSDNPLRPDTLDTITVVLFGEESPRMQQLMEEKYQQVFIDEINTKVELMYLPWTENGAGGKVDLMIASGQEFDACIVDPTWAASSYSKGYLQDLSDVIDKYLPDWHENMNATAFDAYRYDGGGF